MTETTEENTGWNITYPVDKAREHLSSLTEFRHYVDYINERQGHSQSLPPPGDFLCAVSQLVTSLTKERDELKEQINNPWRSHKAAPRNGMEITALFGGEEENQIPTIIRYDAEDDEWIDRDYSSFWGDAEFIWTTAPYSEHNNDCRLSNSKGEA